MASSRDKWAGSSSVLPMWVCKKGAAKRTNRNGNMATMIIARRMGVIMFSLVRLVKPMRSRICRFNIA